MGNIPTYLRMVNNNLRKTKPTANINTVLPPELLEMVLRYLPPSDLRNAMLVCHLWREVGQAPRLWRKLWSSKIAKINHNFFLIRTKMFNKTT